MLVGILAALESSTGQIAGGVGEGTGIAAGAEAVAQQAGVVPAAGVPAAGAAAAAAAAGAGAGVPAAGAVDPNAAFNSFISPFFNQVDGLTPAQLIQLGASNFDLTTIASTLGVDATALSNAIAQATNNAATAGAGTGTEVVPAAGAGAEVLTAGERANVNTGKYTDNGDGTYSDAVGNIFNEVDGQLTVDQFYTGQELIDQDIAAKKDAFNSFIAPFSNQKQLTPAQLIQLGGSDFDLTTIASTLDVDPTELSGAIAQATSAAQTESIFSAINPSDISKDDAKSVADLILDGKTGIGNVAERFDNISDMDVIEGMLRGGYESPAAMTERLAPANTGLTETQLMASLLSQKRTTPEELAAYYGNNPDYPEYAGSYSSRCSRVRKRPRDRRIRPRWRYKRVLPRRYYRWYGRSNPCYNRQ